MKLFSVSLRVIFIVLCGLHTPLECRSSKKPVPKINKPASKVKNTVPKIQRITNRHLRDGFGYQYLDLISAAIYAELNGMQFWYSPFAQMGHNYDKDPDFLKKKEWLINFIDSYEIDKKGEVLTCHDVMDFFMIESNMAHLVDSPAMKKIKQIFWANKDPQNYLNNGCFNIAVHVRKYNPDDGLTIRSDVTDEFYLKVISQLRTVYADKQPIFHLYSQGLTENFKSYESEDTIFHLNESIEDSFISMVAADVLVTSKSTLSYTAALLSDGAVYYVPCWFARLPHWMNVHELL